MRRSWNTRSACTREPAGDMSANPTEACYRRGGGAPADAGRRGKPPPPPGAAGDMSANPTEACYRRVAAAAACSRRRANLTPPGEATVECGPLRRCESSAAALQEPDQHLGGDGGVPGQAPGLATLDPGQHQLV